VGVTSYLYSACSILPKEARFIHYQVQEMYNQLLWRSAAQALGHMYGIVRPIHKHFLMPNFADGENMHFTIRILSRPNLSITVTETVVKGTSMVGMEVESGIQRGETILLSTHSI